MFVKIGDLEKAEWKAMAVIGVVKEFDKMNFEVVVEDDTGSIKVPVESEFNPGDHVILILGKTEDGTIFPKAIGKLEPVLDSYEPYEKELIRMNEALKKVEEITQ